MVISSLHGILTDMILSTRRRLLFFLRIPALGAVVVSGLCWYLRFQNLLPSLSPETTKTLIWWRTLRPVQETDLFWTLTGLTWLAGFSFISELLLRKRFLRSPSLEIFFLRLFLLTLPWQTVRLGLLFTGTAAYLGWSWSLLFIRISLFGRFAGLAVLINTGIFGGGLTFSRSGSILSMGILGSLALAVLMPLDITQPMGNLMFLHGEETALAILTTSLGLLAAIAMLGSLIPRNIRETMILFTALLFLAGGTDLVMFASSPLLIPGMVLMVLGTVLFSWQVHKIYQWL